MFFSVLTFKISVCLSFSFHDSVAGNAVITDCFAIVCPALLADASWSCFYHDSGSIFFLYTLNKNEGENAKLAG